MNLRQVRSKIKSVKNVKKITKAMQLVSAVKMRKAQQVAVEGRPYNETLEHIINKIVPTVEVKSSPLLAEPVKHEKKEHELIILVSSNKGLAGAFNVNLFRVLLKIENIKQCDFVTLGKKGAFFANNFGKSVIADFSSGNPSIEVSAVFDLVLEKFIAKEYTKISLIYNKFISTLRSEVVKETILPITLETESKPESSQDYVVEPTRQELLDFVLKSYVESRIRNAVLDSEAAEHSARMIAMKNATDNANDLIITFTSLGNKLRQNKITSELLDMITAKESIEGLE